MDVPTANQNNQVPWTKEKIGEAVIPPGFKANIHIFWGPGQLTIVDQLYNPPDPKAWHNFEPLSIPQVTRFIYAVKDDYKSDDYTDDSVGPPPPPPPGLWAYHSVVQWGLQASLKPAYRGSPIPGDNQWVFTIDPGTGLWDEAEFFGDLGAGVMWNPIGEAAHFFGSIQLNGTYDGVHRVTIRNSDGSGAPLYQGPIEGCPYFDLLVWRSVTWTRSRTDNGFTVFVAAFQNYNPPGTDGTGPPRCSFTDYGGITLTEHPLSDYMAILGNHGPC